MLPINLGLEQLKMVYDFFAASHGKGAVDGIDGSAKRGVMAKILSRKAIVKTAEEFASTGANACPGIQLMHVSKQELEGYREELDMMAWDKEGAPHGGLSPFFYPENFRKSIDIFYSGAR